MRTLICCTLIATITLSASVAGFGQEALSAKQLDALLDRFPAADTNGDGELSLEEAMAYRNKMGAGGAKGKKQSQRRYSARLHSKSRLGPRAVSEYAVCYKTPAEIKAIFEQSTPVNNPNWSHTPHQRMARFAWLESATVLWHRDTRRFQPLLKAPECSSHFTRMSEEA